MTGNTTMNEPDGGNPAALTGKKVRHPEWADGLRKLYDSVVDEPLPDSFRDLLDQLDKTAK